MRFLAVVIILLLFVSTASAFSTSKSISCFDANNNEIAEVVNGQTLTGVVGCHKMRIYGSLDGDDVQMNCIGNGHISVSAAWGVMQASGVDNVFVKLKKGKDSFVAVQSEPCLHQDWPSIEASMGKGRDIYHGTPGIDTVSMGKGFKEVCFTYEGDDIVTTGGGATFVHTGDGDDTVLAQGSDVVVGGEGTDIMETAVNGGKNLVIGGTCDVTSLQAKTYSKKWKKNADHSFVNSKCCDDHTSDQVVLGVTNDVVYTGAGDSIVGVVGQLELFNNPSCVSPTDSPTHQPTYTPTTSPTMKLTTTPTTSPTHKSTTSPTCMGTIEAINGTVGDNRYVYRDAVVIGNLMFDSISTPDIGFELMVYDFTTEETTFIDVINPGPANSVPLHYTECGGLLYFLADGSDEFRQLWVTAGTVASTHIEVVLKTGGKSKTDSLVCHNGLLYISHKGDQVFPKIVSRYDPANAAMGLTIVSSAATATKKLFVGLDRYIMFSSNTGGHVYAYDTQNALSNDAVFLIDAYPGSGTTTTKHYTNYNGRVLFASQTFESVFSLFITDCTGPNGTYQFEQKDTGVTFSYYGFSIEYAGAWYFSGEDDSAHIGIELFRMDAFDDIQLVKDLNVGSGSFFPSEFTLYDDRMFFLGRPKGFEETERLLHSYDALTDTIEVISPILVASHVRILVHNNLLYFSSNDGVTDVLRYDGSEANVVVDVGGYIDGMFTRNDVMFVYAISGSPTTLYRVEDCVE